MQFGVSARDTEAEFVIRDHGMGIPIVDQASLFKAFHHVRNAGRVPGTGLELPIVKRCLELHGVHISFESDEGKGTTFRVRLPLV